MLFYLKVTIDSVLLLALQSKYTFFSTEFNILYFIVGNNLTLTS